jgi:hypothetical protein
MRWWLSVLFLRQGVVVVIDGHRFAGTGSTDTGAGDQIVTRDIPVPVLAGDGSVTGL